jgi:endonuclease/exonuclease/phosphatase family metal-dependent hydrolase
MGDANAKVDGETVHQPTIGKHSLHGDQKYVLHAQTNPTPNLALPDGHTFNQIDQCLIDGRHFSHVIDVMARRGANIDSDHMLVVIKLRARI